MCERYSWIEKDGNVLFLTTDQVFNSKRGRELRKHTTQPEDWHGHGAIRFYYNLKNGTQKECTDFSTPDNFPPEIVKAIKTGQMWGFGITREMSKLLTEPADKAYQAAFEPAFKAYQAAREPAFKAYQAAFEPAFKAYQAAREQADKVYQAATEQADKAYQAAFEPAFKVYQAVTAPAFKAYQAATEQAFANLFAKPKNRNPLWR